MAGQKYPAAFVQFEHAVLPGPEYCPGRHGFAVAERESLTHQYPAKHWEYCCPSVTRQFENQGILVSHAGACPDKEFPYVSNSLPRKFKANGDTSHTGSVSTYRLQRSNALVEQFVPDRNFHDDRVRQIFK